MTSMSTSQDFNRKKRLGISDLMSPAEEPCLRSFSDNYQPAEIMGSRTSNARHLPGPAPPLSPPISPATKLDSAHPRVHVQQTPINDPILYPQTQSAATFSPPQAPLFAKENSPDDYNSIIDQHVEARKPTLFTTVPPPETSDYLLALYFQVRLHDVYKKDPGAWLERERNQLKADNEAARKLNRLKQARYQRIMPAKPQYSQQPIRRQAHGVTKPTKPSRQPARARPIHSNLPPSATPRQQPAARRSSNTPDPTKRQVAPNREDKDFESLPNYCPPLSSLPEKVEDSLSVEWKGSSINLDQDPFRHLLHPHEMAIASKLRLDCATYITSKRRLFMSRIECLKKEKEFRKTDAQQACKIDVNKASKLWMAFEKVGWLQKHWVTPFLNK